MENEIDRYGFEKGCSDTVAVAPGYFENELCGRIDSCKQESDKDYTDSVKCDDSWDDFNKRSAAIMNIMEFYKIMSPFGQTVDDLVSDSDILFKYLKNGTIPA